MADQKKTTGATLLTRGGGFALAVPVVLILGYLLLVLNLVMLALIVATIFNIGGVQGLIGEFLFALIAIFALGVTAFLALIYATGRYIGGLRQLWRRIRGIRDEQARVEGLIEQAAVENLSMDDDGEISAMYLDDAAQGQSSQ